MRLAWAGTAMIGIFIMIQNMFLIDFFFGIHG
jgi:hypothetical protein